MALSTTDVDTLPRDLAAVARGEHHDPHRILGLHRHGDGPVVRAWRPAAEALRVLIPGGAAITLPELGAGLFSGPVPEEAAAGYQLQADYPSGVVVTFDDPYRFVPTLGDLDLYLLGEGTHRHLWRVLGAHIRCHQGVLGTSFAVWAPNARSVRVVGDFNLWDGRLHPMRSLGSSGVWELFLPGVGSGARYKFEIVGAAGHVTLKADPMAGAAVEPPGTDSVVAQSNHEWADASWLAHRAAEPWRERPVSIYEMHLASWKRVPEEGQRSLSYRELAEQLPAYLLEMGFTHVEFMPVAEHPYAGSWGYQVSSYFAPTARFGPPDDFRTLVDALHGQGIGVIVDWVPGHFPRDTWALAQFDGTALYEHEDPRKGAHQEWGTLVFNYGRNEVRNFLVANANFWFEEYHIDGLRVDGVASMLYLDYARHEGGWIPNQFGGREHLEAVGFIRQLNEVIYDAHPDVMMIAEESTSWPAVSRPTYLGGLGFGFKWNMGWMHDTLEYFSQDPIHRRFHHNQLTFGMLYAFTENFILPLCSTPTPPASAARARATPAWWWPTVAAGTGTGSRPSSTSPRSVSSGCAPTPLSEPAHLTSSGSFPTPLCHLPTDAQRSRRCDQPAENEDLLRAPTKVRHQQAGRPSTSGVRSRVLIRQGKLKSRAYGADTCMGNSEKGWRNVRVHADRGSR